MQAVAEAVGAGDKGRTLVAGELHAMFLHIHTQICTYPPSPPTTHLADGRDCWGRRSNVYIIIFIDMKRRLQVAADVCKGRPVPRVVCVQWPVRAPICTYILMDAEIHNRGKCDTCARALTQNWHIRLPTCMSKPSGICLSTSTLPTYRRPIDYRTRI
jgi:hypothetical protein